MFDHIPTQIAGVLYLLFIILLIVILALHTSYWVQILTILLISIPYTLISIYDIDCVFSGQCDIWGWIKGIFFILYVLISVIICILALTNFQEVINTTKETPPVLTSTAPQNSGVLITYSDKNRGADPGGNGTFTKTSMDNSREYIATSNCVYNTSNQSWSGTCTVRK